MKIIGLLRPVLSSGEGASGLCTCAEHGEASKHERTKISEIISDNYYRREHGISAAKAMSVQAFTNKHSVTFSMTLPEAGPYQLRVFDLHGRAVWTICRRGAKSILSAMKSFCAQDNGR